MTLETALMMFSEGLCATGRSTVTPLIVTHTAEVSNPNLPSEIV